MIGLGVIGFGMIGRSFAEATTEAGFAVRAVMSRTLEAPVPGLEEVRIHRDLEAFVADKNIEAAVVCTPHWMHAADAIRCLASGLHVLIEKPIVTNAVELADLKEAIGASTAVALALPHGQHEYLDIARKTIESGRIGPVTMVESVLDIPGPPRSNWYYSKAAVGGASFDTLPYALSRVLYLLGTAPVSATGVTGQLIRHRSCGDGLTVDQYVDDSASLLLVMPYGQQVLVRSNWCVAEPNDVLTVHGRYGRLDIDCWTGTVEVTDSTGIAVVVGRGKQTYGERDKLEVFRSRIEQGQSEFAVACLTMEYILATRAGPAHRAMPVEAAQIGPELRQLRPPEGYW